MGGRAVGVDGGCWWELNVRPGAGSLRRGRHRGRGRGRGVMRARQLRPDPAPWAPGAEPGGSDPRRAWGELGPGLR